MITPSFALTATERVLPKLALDFTTANLDSRITFTRSGNTATVTNSSGFVAPINADLPRFDFNPVTLACRGLLIEESRSNICLQSAAFSTASWVKSSTTANLFSGIGNSPDGATNASKVITNNGVGRSGTGIYQVFAKAASSTTYTASAYFKAGEVQRVRIFARDSANSANSADFAFNVSTGATISAPTASGTFTNVSGTLTDAGNGWYRATLTYTTGTEVSIWGISLLNATSTGTGDGSGGFYIWGAQLEAGAFATSYIPTTTTALTRNVDVATMTGTNFSSWFNASQGAFAAWFTPDLTVASNTRVFNVSQAGGGNTVGRLSDVFSNGTTWFSFNGTTNVTCGASAVTSAQQKLTSAYAAGSYAANLNGGTGGTASSATLNTPDRITLGALSSTTGFLNGRIQKILYWPQRITNAEVQAFSK